jgi:hypothetical protein
MYHMIQFAVEFVADLEVSPKHLLEQTVLKPGTCLRAQVRPYIMDAEEGPVEVADLFFEDGTTTRRVPFRCFAFVD